MENDHEKELTLGELVETMFSALPLKALKPLSNNTLSIAAKELEKFLIKTKIPRMCIKGDYWDYGKGSRIRGGLDGIHLLDLHTESEEELNKKYCAHENFVEARLWYIPSDKTYAIISKDYRFEYGWTRSTTPECNPIEDSKIFNYLTKDNILQLFQ